MTKWALSQGCKDSSVYKKQSIWYNILTYWRVKTVYDDLNRLKRSFSQNWALIYDKSFPESRHRRNLLHHDKSHIQQPTVNILSGENVKAFPPRWGTRQPCPLSPLLLSIVLEDLTLQLEKKKKTKRNPNWKRRG